MQKSDSPKAFLTVSRAVVDLVQGDEVFSENVSYKVNKTRVVEVDGLRFVRLDVSYFEMSEKLVDPGGGRAAGVWRHFSFALLEEDRVWVIISSFNFVVP